MSLMQIGEIDYVLKHPRRYFVLGHIGMGKTSLGLEVLKRLCNKHNLKAYVLSCSGEEHPDWVKTVERVEEVEENSVVLVDDADICLNPKQTHISDVLNLKDCNVSVIIVTSRPPLINYALFEDVVMVKFLPKFLLAMYSDTILPSWKHRLQDAIDALERIPPNDLVKYAYVISIEYEGLIRFG